MARKRMTILQLPGSPDEFEVYETLPENLVTTVALGGIPKGTTIPAGTSIIEIFQMMLSPAVPTLDTPVVTLVGSVLSWGAVSGATSYKVYANDVNITGDGVQTTSVDLAALINTPGTYSMKVKAFASGYNDSEFSEAVTFIKVINNLYYGMVPNVTRDAYKDLSDADLIACTSGGYSGDSPISWSPSTASGVLVILVKDGINPVSASFASGGLVTNFTANDIMGINGGWNCSGSTNGHADITIDGETFHCYGYRMTTFNTSDVMSVNF